MAEDARKSRLIAELDRARGELWTNAHAVRRELDVATRLKSSFRRHGLMWLAGAGVVGLLLARRPRRGKVAVQSGSGPKAPPKRSALVVGTLIAAIKLAFYLARPALMKWVSLQINGYAESRFNDHRRR